MGRGSRQTQQGQSSAAAAAAAAAAPPQPPAAEAVPDDDEAVWRLLLGELWQPPEQQVVCRLLCCSRAMARLVHELCAGRLIASISRQPNQAGRTPVWQQQVTARGAAYSTWLAKHARLLAELRLEVWEEQEQHVAAGLRAAAGLAATDMPQRVTRSTAAVGAAAAAAAAAAPATEQAPAGPLLLLRLRCNTQRHQGVSLGMSLQHSLVACPQLTQLQLNGAAATDRWQQRDWAAAFAPLSQLRELTCEAPDCGLVVTLPRLQLGLQLTKLQLAGMELSAEGASSLPPSLADLECNDSQELPAIGHLTALTRLSCESVDAGSSLPPSLEVVRLEWCSDLAPLHALTRLRSLQCDGGINCSLEQLQAAVSAIGPSLAALDLEVEPPLSEDLLASRVTGTALPLRALSLLSTGSVAHLGQWTGLTRLELEFRERPSGLSEQLKQLTVLKELELEEYRADLMSSELQGFVDCVACMASLRSFVWYTCLALSDAQEAQLRGATQLTSLHLHTQEQSWESEEGSDWSSDDSDASV